MNSPEKSTRIARSMPFAQTIRQRVSDLPERPSAPVPAGARSLTGFAIARIYTTFRLKRDEYFPVELDDAAFEVLIDLYLFEWLNRRAGPQQDGGMRLAADAPLPSGVAALVDAGLASVTQGDVTKGAAGKGNTDPRRTVSLSRAGNARLNIFFDYMATYIAAM